MTSTFKSLLRATAVTGSVIGILAVATTAQAAPFTLTHTVNNPQQGFGDYFGYSVDVSGGTAIVGARFDDTNGVSNGGGAYLVDVATGAVSPALVNPNASTNDEFGFSVGISGNKAVVGAYREDGPFTDQGEAYVYDTTTGNLITTLINPSASNSDQFGWATDISGDKVVVGARLDDATGANAGAAYVFDAVTGSLLNTLINPLTSSSDHFGFDVAIDGNLIAVSSRLENTGASNAGAVYVYDATTGGLVSSIFNPTPQSNDHFGWSVDIDNGNVLVGSALDSAGGVSNTGQAFLFDALSGNLLQTFDNPDPIADDNFGRSVDLSGGLAVIGARGQNVAGQNDAGAGYVFDVLTGDMLQTLNNPTPNTSDWFAGGDAGGAIAIDGGTIIAGAFLDDIVTSNNGIAYIYNADLPEDGVPTPGALALLGLGLLGVGLRRSRTA